MPIINNPSDNHARLPKAFLARVGGTGRRVPPRTAGFMSHSITGACGPWGTLEARNVSSLDPAAEDKAFPGSRDTPEASTQCACQLTVQILSLFSHRAPPPAFGSGAFGATLVFRFAHVVLCVCVSLVHLNMTPEAQFIAGGLRHFVYPLVAGGARVGLEGGSVAFPGLCWREEAPTPPSGSPTPGRRGRTRGGPPVGARPHAESRESGVAGIHAA